MARIKVAHVVNIDLGLRTHLANYMRYQADLGYEVSAVVGPGPWLSQDTTILSDIFVKIIPFKSKINPLEDMQSLARLISYFRKNRFDIVHTHAIKPGFLGRLAARLTGVPIIIHTFHGLSIDDQMPALRFRLFKYVEILGCKCGHSAFWQTREDREFLIRMGICPADKLHYLGNGIDLSRFDPRTISAASVDALRSELGILPHEAVIGFIGRIDKEKGIHEFIEAASLLRQKGIPAKYLVVGRHQPEKRSDVSVDELLRECEGRQDILFLGYRTDVPTLLMLMDILTLPSYREGMPRCLMEAAAMGRPVVATHVRGTRETVVDGKTGILVAPCSSMELADGILELLNHPDLQQEIGRNAREHALKHFDERLFFARTDQEYRRLIKERLGLEPELILRPGGPPDKAIDLDGGESQVEDQVDGITIKQV